MKKIILISLAMIAVPASAQVHVDGYTRRDGAYVPPHYRSAPDSSRYNNYSSQGNYNPYSGRVGTQNPYTTPSYQNPGTGYGRRANPYGY